MTTVFVVVQAWTEEKDADGEGICGFDSYGVDVFSSCDAAKRYQQSELSKRQDDRPADQREVIEWRDLPDGGAYTKLDDGEEIQITPRTVRDI
jgi:hypothetical protein